MVNGNNSFSIMEIAMQLQFKRQGDFVTIAFSEENNESFYQNCI